MFFRTDILLAVVLLFLLTKPVAGQQGIEEILRSAKNQEAFWSVSVVDEGGGLIDSHQPEKLVQTASNLKLFSSAAILDALGSDFTFQTKIFGRGELKEGVWNGDLVIKGSGDPSISGTLYNDDPFFVFNSLYDQLKTQGINAINGVVHADISLFDDERYPKGWDWDDLSFYYGVEITPLSFNNNTVDLLVEAYGAAGSKPRISWFPFNTDFVNFVDEQLITDPGKTYEEFYLRIPGTNTIVLRSRLPRGYLEKESLSVHNGALYFVDTFIKYLKTKGIDQHTTAIATTDSLFIPESQMQVLAVHTSKPLGDMLLQMNKESDNFYAEMLLKSMAAYRLNEKGSYKSGVAQVRKFLSELDVDTALVEMRDASGMSSGTMTTTRNLAFFLYRMKSHPEFDTYYSSLSVSGTDGTLRYRMTNQPLKGKVHGKSGYMRGVRTLSGYLTTKAGNEITFSIAANNFTGKVRSVDRTQEAILEYLYENR